MTIKPYKSNIELIFTFKVNECFSTVNQGKMNEKNSIKLISRLLQAILKKRYTEKY